MAANLAKILFPVRKHVDFGRERFVIATQNGESPAFSCFEFAKMLFDDFYHVGLRVKAFFLFEDGTRQDITELFV